MSEAFVIPGTARESARRKARFSLRGMQMFRCAQHDNITTLLDIFPQMPDEERILKKICEICGK